MKFLNSDGLKVVLSKLKEKFYTKSEVDEKLKSVSGGGTEEVIISLINIVNVTHTTTLSGWVARLKIVKYKEYALIFLEEINKGKTTGNLITKISSYKIQNIKGVYCENGNEKFYCDFQITSKGLEVRYINANYGGSSGRQGGGYAGSGSSIEEGYTRFSVGDAAFIGACLLN